MHEGWLMAVLGPMFLCEVTVMADVIVGAPGSHANDLEGTAVPICL